MLSNPSLQMARQRDLAELRCALLLMQLVLDLNLVELIDMKIHFLLATREVRLPRK